MVSNVCGTWNDRAMPSFARASGGRLVMSWPSKRTLPDVASKSPVRQLNKVDLPAPFGPIRPRMSPCSSVTEAASTALKLPNAFVTSRASRSMSDPRRNLCRRRLAASRPESIDQRENAARLETRDQDDDRAVEDERQSCALAAKQIVGNLLQRDQNCRADQRSKQQPGA